MTKDNNASSVQALIDATSGAMGALVSTSVLYPIDLAKTHQQAHVHAPKDKDAATIETKTTHKQVAPSVVSILRKRLYQEGVRRGLFKGLSAKAVHTVLSNFCYFYWFSYLQNVYRRWLAKQTAQHPNKPNRVGTFAMLSLAALAGAINITLTLPLETLTARAQTTSSDKGNKLGEAAHDTPDAPVESSKKSEERKVPVFTLRDLTSLWGSYLPALLLVANPTINYTVFERLKAKMLYLKARRGNPTSKLSSIEAFLMGAISKTLATLVTYPLIRAKVLMQTTYRDQDPPVTLLQVLRDMGSKSTSLRTKDAEPVQAPGTPMTPSRPCVLPPWMGNLQGYYIGLNTQLVHTVVKSAVLLMMKEEIAQYTSLAITSLTSRKTKTHPASR